MQTDWNDLSVTLADASAAQALNGYLRAALADAPGRGALLNAATDAPFVLTLAAFEAADEDTPAGRTRAQALVARARLGIHAGGVREQLWLAAVDALSQGDDARAFELWGDVARSWPRDLLALKALQRYGARLQRHDAVLSALQAAHSINDGRPWFHGLLAHAHWASGDEARARAEARRAHGIEAQDPWAMLALAGLDPAPLADGPKADARLGAALALAQALRAISEGRLEDGAARLDQALHQGVRDPRALAYVLHGFLRLELAGMDAGDRWRSLGDAAFDHRHDRIDPMLDLHFLLGLARAGLLQAALDLRDGIQAMAEGAPSAPWSVAAPLAHGLMAWAQGDGGGAFRMMTPDMPKLAPLSLDGFGPDGARELFWQIWYDAGFRAGYGAALGPRIAARAAMLPQHPLWKRLSSNAERTPQANGAQR